MPSHCQQLLPCHSRMPNTGHSGRGRDVTNSEAPTCLLECAPLVKSEPGLRPPLPGCARLVTHGMVNIPTLVPPHLQAGTWHVYHAPPPSPQSSCHRHITTNHEAHAFGCRYGHSPLIAGRNPGCKHPHVPAPQGCRRHNRQGAVFTPVSQTASRSWGPPLAGVPSSCPRDRSLKVWVETTPTRTPAGLMPPFMLYSCPMPFTYFLPVSMNTGCQYRPLSRRNASASCTPPSHCSKTSCALKGES